MNSDLSRGACRRECCHIFLSDFPPTPIYHPPFRPFRLLATLNGGISAGYAICRSQPKSFKISERTYKNLLEKLRHRTKRIILINSTFLNDFRCVFEPLYKCGVTKYSFRRPYYYVVNGNF